ncbi:MAG: hypothetical protein JHD02_10810 [Thermoleophilaceae bacterium]|nr:hypothetical protein [Thermoleophilaceae bacterium]
MKKVGIAARLLAVAAVLSLAAFTVVGCGGDDKENSSSSNSSSDSASAGGETLSSGDTVGESKKVVVGKDGDFDAQQAAVVKRIGEFADATANKKYKVLCNDILSKSAQKIGGDCVRTFSQTGAQLKDFKITVNSVEVAKDGKTATAVVDVTSNVNKAQQSQNLTLIKEGGEWRVQILGQ